MYEGVFREHTSVIAWHSDHTGSSTSRTDSSQLHSSARCTIVTSSNTATTFPLVNPNRSNSAIDPSFLNEILAKKFLGGILSFADEYRRKSRRASIA